MIESMGTLLDRAGSLLLVLLAGSASILLFAATAARLLHNASASLRHTVWAAAIWSLLALPVVAVLAPSVPVRILPSESVESYSALEQPVRSLVASAPATSLPLRAANDAQSSGESEIVVPAPEASASPRIEAHGSSWSLRATIVGAWGTVALLLLAQVITSRLKLSRLAASAWRVHDPAWWRAATRIGSALGLCRHVTLLATLRTTVPLTWGTRAPIVLLPADAHRWPAERREAVLVHELAHVARGDAFGHDVARVAAALYWVNPLVWLALRAMRIERERACDDLVLATGTRASSYAADLLEIARGMTGSPQPAAAALAMARPSDLEGRLLSILDPRCRREPATRKARLAAVIAAVALAVPLAALRPAQRIAVQEPIDLGADSLLEVGRRLLEPDDAFVASNRRIESRADVVAPSAVAAEQEDTAIAVTRTEARQAPVPQDRDVGTLIAVAAAAAGLSSDFEKAELLIAVLARGVRDDSLQRTVLRSAATIDGSYERHRVMLALLRNGVAEGSNLTFLDAAKGIASSYERQVVLTAFVRANGLPNAATRQAFLRAAESLDSDYARSQLLREVITREGFGRDGALDVLPVVRGLSSDHERATLLVTIARTGVTSDEEVRDAYLLAAGSLNSASEYDRVLRAAGLSERQRRNQE